MFDTLFKKRLHKYLLCFHTADIPVAVTLSESEILHRMLSVQRLLTCRNTYVKRWIVIRIVIFHRFWHIDRYSSDTVYNRFYRIVIYDRVIIDRNTHQNVADRIRSSDNSFIAGIRSIYFFLRRRRIAVSFIISITRDRNQIYFIGIHIPADQHQYIRKTVVYTHRQQINPLRVCKCLKKRTVRIYQNIDFIFDAPADAVGVIKDLNI